MNFDENYKTVARGIRDNRMNRLDFGVIPIWTQVNDVLLLACNM